METALKHEFMPSPFPSTTILKSTAQWRDKFALVLRHQWKKTKKMTEMLLRRMELRRLFRATQEDAASLFYWAIIMLAPIGVQKSYENFQRITEGRLAFLDKMVGLFSKKMEKYPFSEEYFNAYHQWRSERDLVHAYQDEISARYEMLSQTGASAYEWQKLEQEMDVYSRMVLRESVKPRVSNGFNDFVANQSIRAEVF